MKSSSLILSLIGGISLFLSGTVIHAQALESTSSEHLFTQQDAGNIAVAKGESFQIQLLGYERMNKMNFIGSEDSYGWEYQKDNSTTENILEQVGPLSKQVASGFKRDGDWEVTPVSYQWSFKANGVGKTVLTFQKYHYDDSRVRNLDGSLIKTLVGTVFFTVDVSEQPTLQPISQAGVPPTEIPRCPIGFH